MSLCILKQAGATWVHRHMPATPEALRKAVTPSRAQSVLAAAWLLPWDGLADRWADHGIPLVLGHALSRTALHGGTATHDTINAQNMAGLVRGGMLPHASGSPAKRRATRALLRRRMPLACHRGARLAHVPQTHRQATLPALGKPRASQAHRDGGAERCAEPAVPKRLDVDRARSPSSDALRRDGARTLVPTATHQDAQTLSLRQTVPGIGTSRRRVRRSAIPAIARVPRVQDGASSCRLVTCATASAGKRCGTCGSPLGHAHRTWAFAAAAV